MKLRTMGSVLLLVGTVLFTGCTNTNTTEGPATSTPDTSTPAVTETITPTVTEELTEDTTYPITVQHAYGETVIESKPESIATISWGNQDVPLALGVVPVGVSKANYGLIEDNGLLYWTSDKFKELGEENPVVFDDTDGLNYEAISNSQPDIILAAYSGITQEEYDMLSEIAPVVAYAENAWQTYWRDQITENATAMGMQAEGEALVKELDALIDTKKSEYTEIQGKTAGFLYFNPADLGSFYVYLPTDPRAAYLEDLGMVFPESIKALAEDENTFALSLSTENIDVLSDIDIIITYGDATVLEALQADALIGTVPAIAQGSVVMMDDNTAIAASCTPSALSIPATIDEYLQMIKTAASKVQ